MWGGDSNVLGDTFIRAHQITALQRKSRERTSCTASERLVHTWAARKNLVLEETREQGSKQVCLLHLKLEVGKIRRKKSIKISAGLKREQLFTRGGDGV